MSQMLLMSKIPLAFSWRWASGRTLLPPPRAPPPLSLEVRSFNRIPIHLHGTSPASAAYMCTGRGVWHCKNNNLKPHFEGTRAARKSFPFTREEGRGWSGSVSSNTSHNNLVNWYFAHTLLWVHKKIISSDWKMSNILLLIYFYYAPLFTLLIAHWYCTFSSISMITLRYFIRQLLSKIDILHIGCLSDKFFKKEYLQNALGVLKVKLIKIRQNFPFEYWGITYCIVRLLLLMHSCVIKL